MEYKLTKAQHTVLEQIVEGKTAVQIAKELYVSENTVYSHIKAIYQELDVHTRSAVVRRAYEEGFVELKK
jgi:two-component system, NarL family, secretion system response regulator SalR